MKSEPPAPLFSDGDVAGQYGNITGLDGGFRSLNNEICKFVWFTFLRKLCAFARELPVSILNVAFAALILDVIDSAIPMWKSHYDVIKPPVRDHISSPILDLKTTRRYDYDRVGCLQRWIGTKHSSHSDGNGFNGIIPVNIRQCTQVSLSKPRAHLRHEFFINGFQEQDPCQTILET